MKTAEGLVQDIERQRQDLEAYELHVLQRRAAARTLREDVGARAYARQVANELAALIERHASPSGRLILADALDETLAEEIVRLAMRHRHALLSQQVSDEGFSLLKHTVWEACGVLEHFVPEGGAR